MEQYIPKSALVAEIDKRIMDAPIDCYGHQRVWAYNDVKDIIDTLEVKENKLPNPRFPHLDNIVDKVFGAGNLESFEYEEAEQLVLLAKEELLKDLEAKEVDLEKEIKRFVKSEEFQKASSTIKVTNLLAKHFFELGLFSHLTWKDIRLISEIGEDFMNSEESDDLWKDEEIYYTAILNKFKEKGRDYKTERQITRELEQKREEV